MKAPIAGAERRAYHRRRLGDYVDSDVIRLLLEVRHSWLADRLKQARATDDPEAIRVCEEMIRGSSLETMDRDAALLDIITAMDEITFRDFNAAVRAIRLADLKAGLAERRAPTTKPRKRWTPPDVF